MRNQALPALLLVSMPSPAAVLAAEDEIVVTAERRAQVATDVALSISRVAKDEISLIGPEHPSELINKVPGATLHRGSGQEHLTAIRSPVLTGGAGAGSFLFLENGVPLRAAGFANINGLIEAQLQLANGVEVVRGPGGAFYGANAIHGVINILTPAPSQNRQRARIAISGDHRQADISIAREARGRGFYAGLAFHDDLGFRADSGADRQQLVLRETDNRGDWSRDTILTVSNLNQETAGFVEGADAYRDEALRLTNANPDAYRDIRSARLQSRFERETTGGTLSLTPYARWTEMEFLMHFLPSQAVEENGHWSVGLQSAWYGNEDGPVTWAAGLDGEYTEGYLSEVQERPTIFSFTQGVHYDYDVTSLALSPFAKADIALDEVTTLSLAARADWTRYDYSNNIDANTPADPGRFLRPADREDDFLTFSPKISLQRTLGDGTGWIGYSEGARPPQTTDLYRLQDNQVVDEIDPERIRNLEAGWRGDFSDRVSGEVVAYYARKENFLFRDADGFNVVDGKTRHVGIEAAAEATLTEQLALSFNGTYAEHTYRFDRPVNSSLNATEAITRGDDVDSAPRTLANATLTWTPQDNLSAAVSWVHVGDYYTDAANTNDYGGHDVFDLRLEKHAGFFTGFVGVRNLFDQRYAERADFAFGDERYFPDHGRTLTVGLRFEN